MDFDSAFSIFVSWQSAILCLGIYVITYTIRTIVEVAWPASKTNKFWTELGLPLGPIGTGGIISVVARKFPWPMMAAGAALPSLSARMLYCLVCGLASGWAYNRLRAWMKSTESTPITNVLQPPVVVVPPTPIAPPAPVVVEVVTPPNGDVAPADEHEAP